MNRPRKLNTSAARVLTLVLISALLLSLAGCGSQPAVQDGRLNIVTTTTMLYDLTASIAGEHAEVTALMGPGIDPHLYPASAGDVTKMQKADIVVYNGLHLEGKTSPIFPSRWRPL